MTKLEAAKRHLARILLLSVCFGSGVATCGALAEAGEVRLARLTPTAKSAERLEAVSEVLSTADAGRYRLIFELTREGRFREADRLIVRLEDPLLLGHVLAERYLHPTSYRSSFEELASWLEQYADLPQASRIHRLASRRRPPGAAEPAKPVDGYLAGHGQELASAKQAAEARRLFDRGLAAWRQHRFPEAAQAFGRLAADGDAAGEDRAAGAFWAARAHMLAGRPDLVGPYLRRGAQSSDEFYGLLAQAVLGLPIVFDWYEDNLKDGALELVLRFPAAQRAVALAQIGEDKLAEAEIRKLAARARPELVYPLAALAEAIRLPSAQMRVAQRLRLLDGRRHDGALYPLPAWEPLGGFRLDRALLYAIIRAESAFDIEARSSANARGLMQVLPQTARYVAVRTDLTLADVASLYDPSVNMRIGQDFLLQLSASKTINGSLVDLIAAYNAGEGRLARWLKGELSGMEKDPLLFIESLPITETRNYVKKVLANLWAYRARLDQEIPSLQALAANRWPEVETLDR